MSDLIDRQAAIDALAKFVPYAICDESTESYTNGLTDAYNLICQLPSAEPVRHGKWITEECLPGVAVCSICGHEIRGIGCQYTKYCDECGARMDKDE